MLVSCTWRCVRCPFRHLWLRIFPPQNECVLHSEDNASGSGSCDEDEDEGEGAEDDEGGSGDGEDDGEEEEEEGEEEEEEEDQEGSDEGSDDGGGADSDSDSDDRDTPKGKTATKFDLMVRQGNSAKIKCLTRVRASRSSCTLSPVVPCRCCMSVTVFPRAISFAAHICTDVADARDEPRRLQVPGRCAEARAKGQR